MVRKTLPPYTMRSGKKGYIYYRRDGVTKRLPDDPASAEFAVAYARVRAGGAAPAPTRRTMKKLIARYMRSNRWAELAPGTQKNYRQSIKYFEDKIGGIDPASLRRRHVIDMRDSMTDKPTTANRRVGFLSVLLEHAINIDWIDRNPAKGVQGLRSKKPPRLPWPPDLIAAARATADPDTLLLFEMLLGTGQRISDVLAMQWGQVADGGIEVTQGKTGARLFVPFTDRLEALLDATPRRGLHIITLPDGRPMGYNAAWRRMMDLRKAIGADAYDNHALRHAAASEIAAIKGMTAEHVKAITGHSSLEMVRLYSGAAQQKARAKEAQKGRK